MEFNTEQISAIQHSEHLALVACPGSGKTHTMIGKTLQILRSHSSAYVVLCTFSKAASLEMDHRLNQRIRASGLTPRYCASTFHSLCIRTLMANKQLNTLLSPGMQSLLLQRAAAEVGFPEMAEVAAGFLDSARIGTSLDDDVMLVVERYFEMLQHEKAHDFGAAVESVVNALETGRFQPLPSTHIIVDEFQDIDPLQFRWLMAHKNRSVLTVVGDDDQSIYSFRHSMGYQAFVEFEKQTSAKRLYLSTNYRCLANILQPSAQLIQNNYPRASKRLIAGRGAGGQAKLFVAPNIADEMSKLAETIQPNPATWAVITRTNRQLDDIEGVLLSYQVPYLRMGGKNFWDQTEPSLLLALLTSISDQNIEPSVVNTIQALRSASRAPQIDVIAEIKTLTSHYRYDQPASFDIVFSEIKKLINPCFVHDSFAARRFESAVISFARLKGSFAQRINLLRHKKVKSGEGAVLLTMHGAKGLEFERVWIPFAYDGNTPSRATESKSVDVQEERRLFYVAMTRAKDELQISYPARTRSNAKLEPSRFLYESLLLAMPQPASV